MKDSFVSAPGKVLIVGGYLVLERPNIGIVVTVSARVYAHVSTSSSSSTDEAGWSTVIVESPQLDQIRKYRFRDDGPLAEFERACTTSSNPFVEHAVMCSLRVVKHYRLLPPATHVRIRILGDNEFYSHRDTLSQSGLPLTHASLQRLGRFQPMSSTSASGQGEHAAALPKTGLGSSAALTAAVVGGILHHFGVVELPSQEKPTTNEAAASVSLTLVHDVAQIAHCGAQGKIGSGFDVASAVFGTCTYSRFTPSCAEPSLLASTDAVETMLSRAGVSRESAPPLSLASHVTGDTWDYAVDHFSLPAGIVLVLGDVCLGGSSTTSMVSAILKWRKDSPDQAGPVWKELEETNIAIAAILRSINQAAEENPQGWAAALEAGSSVVFSAAEPGGGEHDVFLSPLRELAAAFSRAREGLRALGDGAGVPVEPAEQTRLCNATASMQGVVACGVPGAGGYDAVFALTCGESAAERVRVAWERWEEMSVVSLPLHSDSCGIMQLEKWVE